MLHILEYSRVSEFLDSFKYLVLVKAHDGYAVEQPCETLSKGF